MNSKNTFKNVYNCHQNRIRNWISSLAEKNCVLLYLGSSSFRKRRLYDSEQRSAKS